MVRNLSDKSIIYHGPLYDEELASIYRNSDVFIFPTQWDTQAMVIVEALASGLYTLCSDYMRGVYDDFQEMGVLRYVTNDSVNFSRAILETLNLWKEDFARRKMMHSYVEKNRSQTKELEMVLSFISNLYNKSNSMKHRTLTNSSGTKN